MRISGKQTQHFCGMSGVARLFPAPRRLTRLSYPRPTPADHGEPAPRQPAPFRAPAEQHTAARFPEHAVALQYQARPARMKNQVESIIPGDAGNRKQDTELSYRPLLHSKLLAYFTHQQKEPGPQHAIDYTTPEHFRSERDVDH